MGCERLTGDKVVMGGTGIAGAEVSAGKEGCGVGKIGSAVRKVPSAVAKVGAAIGKERAAGGGRGGGGSITISGVRGR